MLSRKRKGNNGITLVALVISIIILLILATISIQSLTNTGIFKRAQEAKNAMEKAEAEQALMLNEYENELNNYYKPTKTLQADGSWNSTKKVNSPQLMTGMTGIYWDGDTEVKVTPDNQDNWYDYSVQKWANAKTEDGSYWVWIPRYAYKIESGRYTSTAGTISVKFLQETSNKDENNSEISQNYPETTGSTMSAFVVHPSFTDGSENGKNNHYMNGEWDKEIAGYWVAKYAAGFQECTQTVASNGTVTEPTINTANVKYSDKNYTSYSYQDTYKTNALSQNLSSNGYASQKLSYPVFRPLTYAYNVISTGDAYTISQEIAKASSFYGLKSTETDSHQMKNSEWGAVAYLTQSSCGRNETEVTINSKDMNNTSKLIWAVTGYENSKANGVAASSTNNKTGIFDLSGCVWEYTAAYISNGTPNLNTYGKSYASTTANANGYLTLSTKYATVYPYNSPSDNDINNYSTFFDKKTKTYGFGDAILETGENTTAWKGDYAYFPNTTSTFFMRGGSWGDSSNAGTFAFAHGGVAGNGQRLPLSACYSVEVCTTKVSKIVENFFL